MASTEEMMFNLATEYIKTNPAKSMEMLLFRSPLRSYLGSTLTEEQAVWLSKDTDNNPTGLAVFAMTPAGKEAVRVFINAYMHSTL